jgi:hypothetical protein
MPSAGWLRRVDLPVDAASRSYIDPPNLDQILDQFANWRANVNGGGFNLNNAGTINAVQLNSSNASLAAMEIGTGGQGYIDIHGNDAAFPDYSLRIYAGANISQILHRGTGFLYLSTLDAAAIAFQTSNIERMRITSGGNLLIGTTADIAGYKLQLAGKMYIEGVNVAGLDRIDSLILQRNYDTVGDSSNIVWPGTARLSCAAVGGGEGGFIFYAQTGAGNGETNEMARMHGAGVTILKCPQANAVGDPFLQNSSYFIYLYEPGNQVAIRVKTSTGAIKQAVFTLT